MPSNQYNRVDNISHFNIKQMFFWCFIYSLINSNIKMQQSPPLQEEIIVPADVDIEEGQMSLDNVKIPIKQQQQEQSHVVYEVTIDNVDNQSVLITGSQTYKLTIRNPRDSREWVAIRKFQDFAWLFNVLKFLFPGYVLPYFCSSQVLDYLNKKMPYLDSRQRHIYLSSRLQELRSFMDSVIKHPIFGAKEELKVFFIENWEQHKKGRRLIDIQIQQYQTLSRNGQGFLSYFNFSWFGQNAPSPQKIQSSFQMQQCKQMFQNYSQQLFALTQKMFLFKHAKEQQINWKAPSTVIDSFQILNAKLTSGNSFTQILITQIQSKILLPLSIQCKKEAQLRNQLKQQEQIQKVINQLKKTQGNDQKLSTLSNKNMQFQSHFKQSWKQYYQQWLNLTQFIDIKFHLIMDGYMNHMKKIWK